MQRSESAPAPAPVDGSRYWVVPHTHWDREWYLTLESFRIRLAETVDGVIDTIHADPEFRFTLDGQAVLLEDYLELRPGREQELRGLLADGRLTVGPCYILPDEYLVGAESLVRNLLLGRQVCERHGARPSPVGYMPDTFGHVSQMPQLLRGFGIDNFLFTRGLGDEVDELGARFRWEAPDGTGVLAIPQLGGYGNALRLGHRDTARVEGVEQTRGENALRTIDSLLEKFGHRLEQSGLRDVLLCNGIDHDPAQRDIGEVLEECRRLRPDDEFRIATYEDYVVVARQHGDDLPVHRGELCGGFEENVLRGVNSARMYLKQANERCERELLVAETLCALAGLATLQRDATPWRYPADELRLAWRELLRNHPHDSICGCSVDEVHDDMDQRWRTARQVAQQLQHNALRQLAGLDTHWSYEPLDRELPRPERAPTDLTVVNTLARERRRMVELLVPSSLADAAAIVARAGDEELACEVAERDGHRWARVAIDVPGLSARALRLEAGDGDAVASAKDGADDPVIENEHYRVRACADGTIDVEVLATGASVRGVLTMLDEGDRGDEYTWCPVEQDEPWTNAMLAEPARVAARTGPVSSELHVEFDVDLPAGVADEDRQSRSTERTRCSVRHVVRLVAGVERIDVTTTVVNRARDHRLRVLVPVAQPDEVVLAEGHFDVVERIPQPQPRLAWHEQPHATHHTTGAVAWGDVQLLGRGLAEYEAIPAEVPGAPGAATSWLAMTLLRCVGWLSREDLATRRLGAGPELPTPDAQCIGTWDFEYALRFGAERAPNSLVHASADMRHDFVIGPEGVQLDGVLDVETDGFVTAIKGAEDGVGFVVRACNVDHEAASALVVSSGGARVRRARLDETAIEPPREGDTVLRPGEIATLRLLPPAPSSTPAT